METAGWVILGAMVGIGLSFLAFVWYFKDVFR